MGAATGFQNPSSCDVINGSELFPSFIGLSEYPVDVEPPPVVNVEPPPVVNVELPPVSIGSGKLEPIVVARIYLVAPGLVQ